MILAVVALLGGGGKTQSEIVEEAIRASLNRQLLLGQITQILKATEEEARQIHGNNDLTEEQKGLNLEKLRVDSKEQIRKLLLPESDLNKTHFDKVTGLYLGHTQFTDAGFAELAKLEKLSALYLDSTEITDKGLEALLAEKTALEAKLKPVIEQRVKKRQAEISEAKAALETYTNSPAFLEAEADKKQKAAAAITDANMTLNDYEQSAETRFTQWTQKAGVKTQWTTLEAKELKSKIGTTLSKEKDGIIFASGNNGRDTFTITAETTLKNLTGLRLEALPDQRLPGNGPGRADDGNFVLTELELLWVPQQQLFDPNLPAGKKQVWTKAQITAAWKGKSATELIQHFGNPTNIKQQGNLTLYFYDKMYVKEKKKKYSTVTFAIEPDVKGGGNVSLIGLVPSSATPIDKPEEQKKLELANAKADFSQESYAVATAIDGKRKTGWGILPQIGKPQTATFEIAQAPKHDGPILLTIVMKQELVNNNCQLGKFRWSVTNSKKPVSFGKNINDLLAIAPEKRDDKQKKTLLDYFKGQDDQLKELQTALANAEKPRPIDPKLKTLQDALARASKPLPKDPELVKVKLNQLKKLHLQDTKITDTGLKEVAKLKQLTSLNLYCSEISSSQITDAGLMEVGTLTNLTMLNLDGQKKITDKGLKELAKLTKLRELHLRRTRVSFTAVEKLQEALGIYCRIYK